MNDCELEVAQLNVDSPKDELIKCSGSSMTANGKRSRAVSFPKYLYNRDELLALKEGRCSNLKPNKLPREFELDDGRWDPDKWFYNDVRSSEMYFLRSDIPSAARIVQNYGSEEKFTDTKHSGVDFKRSSARGSENVPEIVLMPQRNNFNTGCNSLHSGRQRDVSPHREGREKSLKIGSGRLQVSDKRQEKLDSEGSGRGGGGGSNHYEYDRKDDRLRRGDKRGESNARRWHKRDRSSEDLRRCESRFASGSRSRTLAMQRNMTLTEPEWFTRGPSSRADVIELRGFRPLSDDVEVDPEKSNIFGGIKVTGSGDSLVKKNDTEMVRKDHSLETNEKNSAKNGRESKKFTVKRKSESTNPSADLPKKGNDRSVAIDSSDITDQLQAQEFYFSELFKDNSVLSFNEPGIVAEGASRFQAFFNQPLTQKSDKTEPSLFERFPYLNDILDGSLPPSPSIFGLELSAAAAAVNDAQEQKRFITMLEKANLLPTEDVISANKMQFSTKEKEKDITENLKKLLNLSLSTESNEFELLQKCNKGLPSGSRALLAEELEANLLTRTAGGEKRKIVGQNLGPPARLLSGSKVTMVADLENSLMLNTDHISSRKMTSTDPDGQDLAAFNRLLELVQGSGKQEVRPTLQNEGNETVAFTNGSISAKSTEQMMSNSHDESSDCSSLALSLMGNQIRIINRPIGPVALSPIMFGNQPPTNLMTPLVLSFLHDKPPSTSNGQENESAIPRPQQQKSVNPSDCCVLGVEPLLNNSVLNIGKQGTFSPSPNHMTAGAVKNSTSSNDPGGKAQHNGPVSAAFLPMAVMRKMVTDRLAGQNTEDMIGVISNSHSTAVLGVDENAAQSSNSIITSGSIDIASSGVTRQSVSGSNGSISMANMQQALSLQHNQIWEAVKDCLAGATAVQLPLPQHVMLQKSQNIRMNRPNAMGGLLSKQSHTQSVSNWPSNELNRNAPHLFAQLQGHDSAHSQYLSMRNTFPSQLKAQPLNTVRPVNVASWPQSNFQTSGLLPTALVRPDANFPVRKVISSAPVGRAIVKGNIQTSLSAVQPVTQQIPHLKQQHQHLLDLNYAGSFGGHGNVFLPGIGNQWKQVHSGNTVAESLSSNGGGFSNPTTLSLMSNSNYDSLTLSRLFGENLLHHSSVPTIPAFQGHKMTKLTADDLERRLNLGSEAPQLL